MRLLTLSDFHNIYACYEIRCIHLPLLNFGFPGSCSGERIENAYAIG